MSGSTSRSATPGSQSSSRAGSPIWDERKPIDKNLPPLYEVTLAEWVNIWLYLHDSGQAEARDLFALTSHFTRHETGKRHRAYINLDSCRLQPDVVIHQMSDLDSVVGKMTEHVPIRDNAVMKYHMLLSPSHTLRNETHIPGVKVRSVEVPLHKMPNMRIFALEPQAIIRIHYPHLELPGGNVCIDEQHASQWYDRVWRPAAALVVPEELLRDWPTTYADEKFRASTKKRNDSRKGQGQTAASSEQRGSHLQDTGRDFHPVYLNDMLDQCRQIIKNTPDLQWAADFVLGYEMRGLKNRVDSVHPPPDDYLIDEELNFNDTHPRVLKIQELLKNVDPDKFESDSWFLDIATRVVVSDTPDSPAECTFASTDRHARLLCHFTNLPFDKCEALVASKESFRLDEVAHLNNVSGGKLINPRWKESGVVTVQIYTTEKNVTYNMALAHGAQRTSARLCLLSYDRELSSHMKPLLTTFKNNSSTHGVALRVESRVLYENYPTAHLRIPDDVLRPCLYRIERHVFWTWKWARLFSLESVMSRWIAARSTFLRGALPVAGSLLLSLQFMMNALVNRPDDGTHWNEVRDAGCVHEMDRGQLVPKRPLGAYFLPAVHFIQNNQPRSSIQRTVSISTICYLLSTKEHRVGQMEAYNMIKGEAEKRAREDTTANDPPRVGNRQRRITIRSTEVAEDQFVGLIPIPEALVYPSDEEDPEEREAVIAPTQHLTDLIVSLPVQMMSKAPNRLGGGSWCRFTKKQRDEVQSDFFTSLDNLNAAFEHYSLIELDAAKWQSTLNVLLPLVRDDPDHHPEDNGQGLKALSVRQDFITLQRNMEPNARLAAVNHVHARISQSWVWLPYIPAKNNIWPVGKNPAKSSKQVGMPGGPWIVRNPMLVDD